MYERVRDGIHYDAKTGRIVEHHGYSTRIYWSTSMLDYLCRHFPTTLNEELAGCLGVSQRTMIRKARELGLQKDERWLAGIWDERRRMAQAASNHRGNAGWFKPGVRFNPEGEFKPGHRLTQEMEQHRRESISRWYRLHPEKAKAKAENGWMTRRMKTGVNSAK